MRSLAAGLSILLCPALVGGAAEAQTVQETQASQRSRGRLMEVGYLNLDAVYSSGVHAVSQHVSRLVYDEPAGFDFRYATPYRIGLDAAAGLRLWSNLSIGLGVTRSSAVTEVDAAGVVPHPLFFHQPREAELRLDGFNRTELGIRLHAAWTIPLADRFDVTFSAGPSLSLVDIDRAVPDWLDVRETTPYNDVQFDFGRESVRKRVPGATFGVDLTCHFLRRLDPGALFWTAGIGVFARWTTGTSALPEFGPDETLDVGGLRFGGGMRFRF